MLSSKRNIALETLRGVAAFAVVFAHIAVGFFPAYTSHYSGSEPSWFKIENGPWYAFFNGEAAVVFFFVLSGFVLTQRYFVTKDQNILVKGAIKRWPRLLIFVFPTVIISWALLVLGLYADQAAGAVSHSTWIVRVGPTRDPAATSFLRAFLEGSLLTFITGGSVYNAVLWTMKPELIGSFGAFLLAFGLGKVARAPQRVALIAITVVAAVLTSRYFPAFVVGVLLAYFFVLRPFTISLAAAVFMICVALLLMSIENVGQVRLVVRQINLTTYVYIFAAALLITTVLASKQVSRGLSGSFSAFLGRISFPLYAVHLPILLSLGAATYLSFGAVFAGIVTLFVSVAVAAPLAIVDVKWVGTLNGLVNRHAGPWLRLPAR